jgi:F-type H+-transporting ATPase subunit delta
MEELIAKRYIKAIKASSNATSMENMLTIFSTLAQSFKNDKFVQIIESPNVSKSKKLELLLESVKIADSKQVNNLIKY